MSVQAQASTDHVTLAVEGMTCGSCVRSVERALTRVPGVERAIVDLASGRAHIGGNARPEDLISAVQSAGYQARVADSSADALAEQPRKGCCC